VGVEYWIDLPAATATLICPALVPAGYRGYLCVYFLLQQSAFCWTRK
jgi:hypothetical protein